MSRFAILILIGALTASAAAFAQAPSAEEIFDRVDRNAVPGSKILVSEMTIHGRRESRTVRAKSWIEGDDKAFTEYLDPPRERGVKMLKLDEFKVKADKATQTALSDTNIALSPSLGKLNMALIMQ